MKVSKQLAQKPISTRDRYLQCVEGIRNGVLFVKNSFKLSMKKSCDIVLKSPSIVLFTTFRGFHRLKDVTTDTFYIFSPKTPIYMSSIAAWCIVKFQFLSVNLLWRKPFARRISTTHLTDLSARASLHPSYRWCFSRNPRYFYTSYIKFDFS